MTNIAGFIPLVGISLFTGLLFLTIAILKYELACPLKLAITIGLPITILSYSGAWFIDSLLQTGLVIAVASIGIALFITATSYELTKSTY